MVMGSRGTVSEGLVLVQWEWPSQSQKMFSSAKDVLPGQRCSPRRQTWVSLLYKSYSIEAKTEVQYLEASCSQRYYTLPYHLTSPCAYICIHLDSVPHVSQTLRRVDRQIRCRSRINSAYLTRQRCQNHMQVKESATSRARKIHKAASPHLYNHDSNQRLQMVVGKSDKDKLKPRTLPKSTVVPNHSEKTRADVRVTCNKQSKANPHSIGSEAISRDLH